VVTIQVGRVVRKKSFINEAKKRLIFAKKFISKEQIWWNDVIFADKSKFNIFGSDGRKMIWRKTEFKLKNLKPTMSHGDRNLIVWDCILSKRVGELVFIRRNFE